MSKKRIAKWNSLSKRRKGVRILSTIINVEIVILIIISCYKLYKWTLSNEEVNKSTARISTITNVTEIIDDDNTILSSKEEDLNNPYWYFIKFPLIDVDITNLKNENSDTVGWINVNNTNINYPFVQTTNNDYYLTHSFNKELNEAGWLFLDYRNNSSLNNKNSIIYGHSRLNKTMFGSLSQVLKSSWYNNKDNHIIRISQENSNSLWQIFSVYKIKEESYYITTYFENDLEYTTFLNTIKNRSIYNFNVNLTKDDKILTLSTCYSDTERTVVHARLIKYNNKP